MAEEAKVTYYVLPKFIQAMDAKLIKTAYKIGTPRGKLTLAGLLAFLKIEMAELEAAYNFLDSPEEVMSEAVDVANFAMLIFKRCQDVMGDEVRAQANKGGDPT